MSAVLPAATLMAFVLAALALAIAPGPDNLFVLTQATLHGARAGLLVTLGLCTGLLLHTAAVTLGLAALIQASSVGFAALKSAGALYLLWLAWQAWRAGTARAEERPPALSGAQYYRRGIVMNLSNPKVSLFFLAFLPQFADPTRGALAPQFVVLGGLFIAATLLVFGAIALAGARLGKWLARAPAALRLLNRLAALIFVALAARLMLSSR